METRQALLERVFANPDDVDARLVLADHLIEHGETEWGELITAHVELARRIDAEDEGPEVGALASRVKELGKAQAQVWQAKLDGLVHFVWLENGFPWRASIHVDGFEEALERVLAIAPVHTVRLLRKTSAIDTALLQRIAGAEVLDRITGLELGHFFDRQTVDDGIRTLLDAPPHLMHLRYFGMPEHRLGVEAARFLGNCPWQRLEHLDLQQAFRTSEPLVALLAGSGVKRVRRLEFNLDLDDDGARAIADATHLTELENLTLGKTLTSAGIDALVGAEHLRLRALTIRAIGDRGLATLLAAPHFHELRTLTISPGVWRTGALALASSPMHRLRELTFESVGDAGAIAIARSQQFPSLRRLYLVGGLTDVGARALVESETLGGLQHLGLKQNPALGKVMKRELRERFGTGVCSFSR